MTKNQVISNLQNLPDNYNITYQVIDDVVHITLTRKIDEFEKYCDELDDDVFNSACMIFDIISDITLDEFSNHLSKPECNKYKELFKHIVEFIHANND